MAFDCFVNKDIVNTVMGYLQVSSRLINIHLRAVPMKLTVLQAHAPSSDYDDNEIEEFYDQLQNVIDQTPKKGILVVQGDWNAKVSKNACENRQTFVDPSAMMTQMREDSDFWSLPLLTNLCWRTLFAITKHPEDEPGRA